MKKTIAMLLVVCMLAAIFTITAFASEATLQNAITRKSSQLIDRNANLYEISLTTPGNELKVHDEIIIMVDGSYSTDDDWTSTIRPALLQVGEDILDGSGRTHITLMTFGIGDNVVVESARTMDEFNSKLPALPGGLLYGRSSTNCEAGFTGIERYINARANEIDNVYVVYISDGEVNTDETPYDFANWKNTTPICSTEALASIALEAEVIDVLNNPSLTRSNAFNEIFGEKDLSDLNAFFDALTSDELLAYGDKLLAEVFAASGMDINQNQPVSMAERAFLDWQNNGHAQIEDFYYYLTYGNSAYTCNKTNAATRAAAAGAALAANSKIRNIYLIDSNRSTDWMSSLDSNDKITFTAAGNMANLPAILAQNVSKFSITPYNDVVITDYMSKWVNFQMGTIKITDNSTGTVIYDETNGGWQINANRPTAQEVPVIVESVASSDYAGGGQNVIGNTSGTIYKLTWYVKDGAMLRSDNYTLSYKVSVDTKESGFSYSTTYPSNGLTTETFKTETGSFATNEIKIPTVTAATLNTVTPSEKENNNNNNNTNTNNNNNGNNNNNSEYTDIFDESVPLDDGYTEIFDEEVPKSANPSTGGAASPWMFVVLPMLLMMTAAFVFAHRKNETK